MAIEDAYQLSKDLNMAVTKFDEPWFNIENMLWVSHYYKLTEVQCSRPWNCSPWYSRNPLLCSALPRQAALGLT